MVVENWADERGFETVQYDEGEIEAEEIRELITEVPRDNSANEVLIAMMLIFHYTKWKTVKNKFISAWSR